MGYRLLPPTSDFAFIGYCVCVFGDMRLWDYGVVSSWVCGLVFCVCVCVGLWGCVCVCVCFFVFVFVCVPCVFV